ncbi:MAG TPA: CinA family protein [Aliarcobacter thereius]|uniref:CinA family protein n=1 Tax=Aliarcobacter thereius TaxID=544718 RepID=UPI0010FE9B3B|nr:CinA family protein [Aliarcobacter thereius]TLT05773.1 CinA family protein [Aliarcobacter thereius]HJE03849.1 CinA family protein [Aliarcobacter thereius]
MKKIFTKKNMLNLQNILKKSKKTITCAESCTGGLVASMITKIPGSSEIFNGSLVSYSNEIKHKELNVSYDTLNNFGAVSIETVKEMLDGVIYKFDADYAIAISGIAGPNGGTKNKPVGTVVIGISNKFGKNNIKTYMFKGCRETIQKKAAKTSLKKILKFINKTLDN